MPTTNTIEVCPVCKSEVPMTRDHIVPAWLLGDMAKFNLNWKDIVENGDLGGKMWELMCGPCNRAKGGTIDYSNIVVRLFLKAMIKGIEEKMHLYEKPRKIQVVCGCGRKEPCAVVPTNMTSLVAQPINPLPVPDLKVGLHRHWTHKTCWCGYRDPKLPAETKRHYTKNCWCGHTECTLVQGEYKTG